MNRFTVAYKDGDGTSHEVSVLANSGTHAITVAMNQYQELKLHPGRIVRIYQEETK